MARKAGAEGNPTFFHVVRNRTQQHHTPPRYDKDAFSRVGGGTTICFPMQPSARRAKLPRGLYLCRSPHTGLTCAPTGNSSRRLVICTLSTSQITLVVSSKRR